MPTIAHELFLLSANLSQIKSKELLIKLFIESLNTIFENHLFRWNDENNSNTEEQAPVCTVTKTYGYIRYINNDLFSDETLSLFQNAIQLLAILLEKIEQEKLLNDQKEHLAFLIDEKTKDLLKTQLTLKEQNEEIEQQNEEYRQLNEELYIAKEKTEESERRFKVLHNASFGGIAIHDKGIILDCNQGLSDMTGYSLDELVGMDGLLLIAESKRAFVTDKIICGYEKPYESLGIKKDRQEYPIRLEARNIPYKGKMVRVVEFRDITEQKNAEQEILKAKKKAEESQQNYKQLIDNLHVGIVVHSSDTSIILVNAEATNLLGLTQEQLEGKDALDQDWFFLDESNKRLAPEEYPVNKVFSTKTAIINQVLGINRPLTKDIVWVEVNAFPEFDVNHIIKQVIVSFIDITERKLTNSDLRQRTALFEALLYTTIDGVLIIDQNGKKVFQNQRMTELFHIPKELSENIDDKFQLQYVSQLNKNPEQFLQKVNYLNENPEETSRDELELTNGTFIDRYSAPVLGKDGYKYGRIWLFRDITERKMNEMALIIAKEKAEESDRLKTAFLQNMSHEIRTPMNAIMGFSELMAKHYNNQTKLDYFSKIINSRCEDLLAILNDIVDIAKIESGQLSVSFENVKIFDLFEELKAIFKIQQDRLKKQHLQFDLIIQEEIKGLSINTDKLRLKQILINLINNAFKFTNKGKIEGGCKLDANNQLIFYVTDTGIGISPEKHKYIFERFAQIETEDKFLFGGTGLGLSIVKGLVYLLGGNVWLDSEPGKGTTFYFTIENLSLAKNDVVQKEELPRDNNVLVNKSILIVEDDKYNAEFIGEVLSPYELALNYAITGNEAIKKVIEDTPDLVLMDIGLPDMTGYEAVHRILEFRPTLKIIAQTAYASLDDRNKAINSGCVDYISKPLKSQNLISIINKHI